MENGEKPRLPPQGTSAQGLGGTICTGSRPPPPGSALPFLGPDRPTPPPAPSSGFYSLVSPRLASPLSPRTGPSRHRGAGGGERSRRCTTPAARAVFPHGLRAAARSETPVRTLRPSPSPSTGGSGTTRAIHLLRGRRRARARTLGRVVVGTVPLAERLSGYCCEAGDGGRGEMGLILIFPDFD